MRDVEGFWTVGEFLYEEHVPPSTGLQLLRQRDPVLYSTYLVILCDYFICERHKGRRGRGVAHLDWANYIFPGVEKVDIREHTPFLSVKGSELCQGVFFRSRETGQCFSF